MVDIISASILVFGGSFLYWIAFYKLWSKYKPVRGIKGLSEGPRMFWFLEITFKNPYPKDKDFSFWLDIYRLFEVLWLITMLASVIITI